MQQPFAQHRFTVEEYERMAEVGILDPDARVELLDGQVVEMAPIGSRHAARVANLQRLFDRHLQVEAIVWVQNPIRVDDYAQPHPGVALLREREGSYVDAHPRSEDVLLLIEVADTTLTSDRDLKVPLYGRGGIRETWLVNLPDDCIEVFTKPSSKRGYWRVQRFERGESIAPGALPDVEIAVDEVLI